VHATRACTYLYAHTVRYVGMRWYTCMYKQLRRLQLAAGFATTGWAAGQKPKGPGLSALNMFTVGKIIKISVLCTS
jgi:hypothetical protein